MKLLLDLHCKEPMYVQIVSQFKECIMLDYIACGDVLPSIRTLSSENGISSITVIKAYQILSDDGIIISSPSKGYFVSDDAKEIIFEQYKNNIEKSLLYVAHLAAAIGLSDKDIYTQFKTLRANEECHCGTL